MLCCQVCTLLSHTIPHQAAKPNGTEAAAGEYTAKVHKDPPQLHTDWSMQKSLGFIVGWRCQFPPFLISWVISLQGTGIFSSPFPTFFHVSSFF